MGQSEGGAGAILAAQRISNFEISNVLGFVSAVVGLAPASRQLAGDYTQSLLILQGTHDGDEPIGAGSLAPYEFATPSESKHFGWIHGANHIRMLDTGNAGDVIPVGDNELRIKTATQHLIVQNYVTTFLKWRLAKETKFRPIFIGDGSFNFSQSLVQDVQNDIASGRLRVSPRYDPGEFSPSTSLAKSSDFQFIDLFQNGIKITVDKPAKFDSLKNLGAENSFAHQLTPGFIVEWDRSKLPNPRIVIPLGANVMAGAPKFFEFQAVLADLISNPKDGLLLVTSLILQIQNQPQFISPPAFVTIQSPLIQKTPSAIGKMTRCPLGTIRIPIANWKIPVGAKVLSLMLNFGQSSLFTGRIAVSGFRAVPA